jgi:DNA polymerase-3 subunit epsilon
MIDFVALDFETANERRNSACAIGLTTVRDGMIVDTFSRLIRPAELRFSYWNTRVHGLSEIDVKDAPTFDELWPELLPLLENRLLVAHNASFDMSVLRHSLYESPHPLPRLSYICSVHISRSVWPEMTSHRLNDVSRSLGIKLNHHEAGSDSRASAEIVLRSLRETESISIIGMANKLKIRCKVFR